MVPPKIGSILALSEIAGHAPRIGQQVLDVRRDRSPGDMRSISRLGSFTTDLMFASISLRATVRARIFSIFNCVIVTLAATMTSLARVRCSC